MPPRIIRSSQEVQRALDRLEGILDDLSELGEDVDAEVQCHVTGGYEILRWLTGATWDSTIGPLLPEDMNDDPNGTPAVDAS